MISKYLVSANSTDIIDLFDTCLNILFILIFGLQMNIQFSGVRVQIIFETVNLQVHIYIVIE